MLNDFNERLCGLLEQRTLGPPCASPRAKVALPTKWKNIEDKISTHNSKTFQRLVERKSDVISGAGSSLAGALARVVTRDVESGAFESCQGAPQTISTSEAYQTVAESHSTLPPQSHQAKG